MEKLDFIWFCYSLPDAVIQNHGCYTEELGGNFLCYRVEESGELVLLGKLPPVFIDGDELEPGAPVHFPYSGDLKIWASMLIDGEHSQRFDYRVKLEDGWVKGIEKIAN